MSRALSSELLKLRTTRTFLALVGSSLGLVLLIVGLAAALDNSWDTNPAPGEDLLGIATLAQLFAIVLGIMAVTTEFRHGTITPTLLAVPDRVRLMSAKLIVHLLAGLVLGLLSVGLTLLLSSVIFSARDIDSGLSSQGVLEIGGGAVLSIALYAALGVGIGAVVRNQVGAIVGTLAYLFVIETLLMIIPGVNDVIEKYGLNGVTSGLAPSDMNASGDTLSQLPAGLLLTLYALVFVVVGTALLKRRDIA